MLKLFEFCKRYGVNVEIYNIHDTLTIKFSDNKTNRRYSMCFDDWQIEKLKNKDENFMFKLAIDKLGLESCENTPIINDPSPCRDCKAMYKESFCGCKAYFEWSKRNDDKTRTKD